MRAPSVPLSTRFATSSRDVAAERSPNSVAILEPRRHVVEVLPEDAEFVLATKTDARLEVAAADRAGRVDHADERLANVTADEEAGNAEKTRGKKREHDRREQIRRSIWRIALASASTPTRAMCFPSRSTTGA